MGEIAPHVIGKVLGRTVIDEVTGDWIWTGATTRAGYGYLQVEGRRLLVHRVAWRHFEGPIPPGHDVHHDEASGCRSKACLCPDHLLSLPNRLHGVHHRLWDRLLAGA